MGGRWEPKMHPVCDQLRSSGCAPRRSAQLEPDPRAYLVTSTLSSIFGWMPQNTRNDPVAGNAISTVSPGSCAPESNSSFGSNTRTLWVRESLLRIHRCEPDLIFTCVGLNCFSR